MVTRCESIPEHFTYTVNLMRPSSSPMSPVSRMEDKGQTRRCEQLRQSLQRAFASLPGLYYRAFEQIKQLAVEADLDRYYDIYEISRTDLLEFEGCQNTEPFGSEGDSLKSFKIGFQRMHLARKLCLCSLLALGADGGRADAVKWTTATKLMDATSVETSGITQDVDGILGAGQGKKSPTEILPWRSVELILIDLTVPATPQVPLTPGSERLRGQTRKLNSLSQGIRSLQARMQLLREDAEKLPTNSGHSSAAMTACYDSVGSELKDLLQEWQEGRSTFATSTSTSSNRLSLPAASRTTPSSPTESLGGSTAVDGSPPDRLRSLNSHRPCHRASSSSATSSTEEEVFEAIAFPCQQSTLSREERITKMKEARVRQAIAKSKAEASTHMLKELETVIKLRPRGRTTGRITSI